MYHWLSKPLGTNKLQISVAAQDNLVKRVAAQNATGGKTDSNAVNFTLFLPREAMHITNSNKEKSS